MSLEYENINIDNEKVKNIINAAFEVFSMNDFAKASTNSIVQKADVSRGLLYHYFKNKQDIFDFLIYFSVKVIVTDLDKKIEWENSNVIDRIKQAIILKFEIINLYPFMMSFFQKHYSQALQEVLESKTNEISPDLIERFYKYKLQNKNDPGVPTDLVNKVIQYTIEGVTNNYMQQMKLQEKKPDLEELLEVCAPYFALFQNMFSDYLGAEVKDGK